MRKCGFTKITCLTWWHFYSKFDGTVHYTVHSHYLWSRKIPSNWIFLVKLPFIFKKFVFPLSNMSSTEIKDPTRNSSLLFFPILLQDPKLLFNRKFIFFFSLPNKQAPLWLFCTDLKCHYLLLSEFSRQLKKKKKVIKLLINEVNSESFESKIFTIHKSKY